MLASAADAEDVRKLDGLNTSVLALADLINVKGGNNFLVKKWGKRVIIDKRSSLGGLKAYLDWDSKCSGVKDALMTKVNNRVIEGIDDL